MYMYIYIHTYTYSPTLPMSSIPLQLPADEPK